MDLLNHKTVLVLLSIVILNVLVFVLLWQLDAFIHVHLYNFGLIFSYEWAAGEWHYNLLCWTFIMGAAGFAGFAVIPHYLLGKENEPTRFLRITSTLLPALALIYEGLSIFFLSQIDSIVRNSLYNFGISASFDWSATYEPIISSAYALMIISLMALIIPTIRATGIIEIEIVDET